MTYNRAENIMVLTVILSRAVALARAAVAAFRSALARYRKRRDMMELLRLDDRTLADAGVTRSDILVMFSSAEKDPAGRCLQPCKSCDTGAPAIQVHRGEAQPWRLAA